MPQAGLRAALARRLTGDRAPAGISSGDLVTAAREHRVHLLLAGTLDAACPGDAPLREALRGEYRDAAARAAASDAALTRLLGVAADHGVRPLVVKGAAVAHLVYERPWERPRGDADLFIADDEAAAMRRALDAAGYVPAIAVDGPLVTRQFQYVRERPGELADHVDVHTRLLNPVAFADALAWRDAESRATALPPLGAGARTLADPDALVLACLHRVAHHHGEPDLIWICDIDRLSRRLDEAGWEAFVALAAASRTRAVCRSSLVEGAALFGTPLPPAVLSALAVEGEPSAAFLSRPAGELHVQWLNLRHLPGWRARAALVRQHLFPPRAYMRERYHVAHAWALPICYARRLCAGVPRWLRAQRSSRA